MKRTAELTKAISTYFDAIYYCDVEALDAVFHKGSSLFDADEGEILIDPVANFRADVETRPSPARRRQVRRDEIVLIDWLSDISAVVKLRLQAHENVFVDHLAFVKGSDGWRIVSKVWHLESTAEVITLE